MADELSINMNAQLINASHRESFVVSGLRVDQDGIGAHGPVISVGTSEEVLSFGDVSTPGYVFFRNLDTTDSVTIGPEDTGAMVAMIYLEPGDSAMMRLDPSVVLRAAADAYTVPLQMLLLED